MTAGKMFRYFKILLYRYVLLGTQKYAIIEKHTNVNKVFHGTLVY